ncbi:hypothetical protein PEC301653_00210 [Pectobacterium carotovorum subsp. carotovorum]|nr:hypothetical protein PEC301653_00210 [Pectobacterium carotovorum subsp. carotovorum]
MYALFDARTFYSERQQGVSMTVFQSENAEKEPNGLMIVTFASLVVTSG